MRVVLLGSVGAGVGAWSAAEFWKGTPDLTWPMTAGAAAGLLLGRGWLRR